MNHSLGSGFGTSKVTSPTTRQEELLGDSPAGELRTGCKFSLNVQEAALRKQARWGENLRSRTPVCESHLFSL